MAGRCNPQVPTPAPTQSPSASSDPPLYINPSDSHPPRILLHTQTSDNLFNHKINWQQLFEENIKPPNFHTPRMVFNFKIVTAAQSLEDV